MRTILHVDMDAFYASVEQRDDPSLRGRPVIVGGSSRRGVVLAASYEVRPFGVRSAMSMGEALRRAPHAIVVPPHRDRYEAASAQVFAIFRRYTPLVEPLSLDEAFLDVTASRGLFGDGEATARAIKRDVRAEVELTASAGVATCKFAAKIASDLRKPDGLVVVPVDGIASFLAPLPIERMWGVGPKTAPKMRELGFTTIGSLASAEPKTMVAHFGTWGEQMILLARGEDDREVDPSGVALSIGAEETYEDDLRDAESIRRTLLEHAGRVARRLVRNGLSARTVVVKIKYSDFTIRSRRATLPEPVQDTDAIYRAAVSLLARLPIESRRVRLTGVSVSGIEPGGPPLTLIPDVEAERRLKIEQVSARISERFGDERTVTRATLLKKPPPAG
ncbi:MAG TPA: DNA polymerase IV [Polyangiaceae bacterium]|jgi:DNA polymerase-4